MRILYIHHEYYDRRALYADVMREHGHHVDALEVQDKAARGQVGPKDVRGYDLVWLLSVHYLAYDVITREALDAISPAKLVVYTNRPTSATLDDWLGHYRRFDWLFLHHEKSVAYLRRQGVNAFYIPQGYHPSQYRYTVKWPRYAITFMGSRQTALPPEKDRRIAMLNRLRRFGIVVFGASFRGLLHPSIPVHAYSTHPEQVRVYSRSRINLDIPYPNTSLPEYRDDFPLRNRSFEVPATGNFLLAGDCAELRRWLGDEGCGYYQPDQLEETVAKYLSDKRLRKRIARASYEAVRTQSFWHRFRDMFDIIDGRAVPAYANPGPVGGIHVGHEP